jgi:hypothetical protein
VPVDFAVDVGEASPPLPQAARSAAAKVTANAASSGDRLQLSQFFIGLPFVSPQR